MVCSIFILNFSTFFWICFCQHFYIESDKSVLYTYFNWHSLCALIFFFKKCNFKLYFFLWKGILDLKLSREIEWIPKHHSLVLMIWTSSTNFLWRNLKLQWRFETLLPPRLVVKLESRLPQEYSALLSYAVPASQIFNLIQPKHVKVLYHFTKFCQCSWAFWRDFCFLAMKLFIIFIQWGNYWWS